MVIFIHEIELFSCHLIHEIKCFQDNLNYNHQKNQGSSLSEGNLKERRKKIKYLKKTSCKMLSFVFSKVKNVA